MVAADHRTLAHGNQHRMQVAMSRRCPAAPVFGLDFGRCETYVCSVLYTIALSTTWSLFLTTSWGSRRAHTAGLYSGIEASYSLGERGGSSRAEGWSGWLLATPTILQRPEPFGTRSRATAMASLLMFAMHVWSEPSHVVVVACFPECSRALASRCLAGCRSIQTTTATNYYIQLLALAPKARP